VVAEDLPAAASWLRVVSVPAINRVAASMSSSSWAKAVAVHLRTHHVGQQVVGQHAAPRFFGVADTLRRRMGSVRFRVYDATYLASLAHVREALGENELHAAWEEGTALSADEAIAYAHRGRGERKRPSSGWASLTPTELDVVGLVKDGLGNKEIAARLFVIATQISTQRN
jgi:DNA-binding CsgD family transcriptional regulator